MGWKSGKVPQAKKAKLFHKESHMPDHLAPGIDQQRSGSQMKMMILTEELWIVKKLSAQ